MTFAPARLRPAEWLTAAVALLLLLVSLLDWFEPHTSFGHDGIGWSAWQAFSVVDLLIGLTVLTALVLVALVATQPTDTLAVVAGVVLAVLALLTTLLVAFRVLVDQPGFGVGAPDALVDDTIWAYAGLLLCVAMVYAAYRSLRDERSVVPRQPEPPARRVAAPPED